jgi:hypothetical protein
VYSLFFNIKCLHFLFASCLCTSGWYGLHCTQRSDDCMSSSSEELCGHGTCVNIKTTGSRSYKCICDQVSRLRWVFIESFGRVTRVSVTTVDNMSFRCTCIQVNIADLLKIQVLCAVALCHLVNRY